MKRVCGDCQFYGVSPENLRQGICHGNPPEPAMIGPGKVAAVRPPVGAAETACRHYTHKSNDGISGVEYQLGEIAVMLERIANR